MTATENKAHMSNISNSENMSNMSNASNISNSENIDNTGNKSYTINTPPFPEVTPLAMAYVPFQQFGTLYAPERGMKAGTIFPDLNKPFYGSRGESK